jgi:uncharacterized protein (TIGR00251 family)
MAFNARMAANDQAPFTSSNGRLTLRVRVSPRASREAIERVVWGADGRAALQVRLKAPPVEGAANEALVALLARTLKLRKADVRIVSGETARLKSVELAGDPAAIADALAALVGKAGGSSGA